MRPTDMNRRRFVKDSAIFAAGALLPLPAAAQAQWGAVHELSGEVLLNGRPMSRNSVIQAGQTISTGKDGRVWFTLAGDAFFLRPGSELRRASWRAPWKTTPTRKSRASSTSPPAPTPSKIRDRPRFCPTRAGRAAAEALVFVMGSQRRGRLSLRVRGIARPWILGGAPRQTGANRIQLNVAIARENVVLGLDQARVEATLPKMAALAVALVDVLRVKLKVAILRLEKALSLIVPALYHVNRGPGKHEARAPRHVPVNGHGARAVDRKRGLSLISF